MHVQHLGKFLKMDLVSLSGNGCNAPQASVAVFLVICQLFFENFGKMSFGFEVATVNSYSLRMRGSLKFI